MGLVAPNPAVGELFFPGGYELSFFPVLWPKSNKNIEIFFQNVFKFGPRKNNFTKFPVYIKFQEIIKNCLQLNLAEKSVLVLSSSNGKKHTLVNFEGNYFGWIFTKLIKN